MNSKTCQNCAHFHRHYILSQHCCSAVNCGHCSFPRLKHRAANAAACVHYIPASDTPDLPNRNAVIQFLSKDLLEYILTLELPPEIEP